MSMTIDRIGSVDPIPPGKKPGQTGQVKGNPNEDIISISSEAQTKSELLRIKELASAAPDLRAEKIAELKTKINDPSYINDKVVNATADNIIDALFG